MQGSGPGMDGPWPACSLGPVCLGSDATPQLSSSLQPSSWSPSGRWALQHFLREGGTQEPWTQHPGGECPGAGIPLMRISVLMCPAES